MNIKSYVFSFVGLLLIALVLTLPASLVREQLTLDKDIKTGWVAGPWWSFDVEWLSYRGFVAEQVNVTFKPSCLFFMQACFEINNENIHLQLSQSLFSNTIELEDTELNVTFAQLSPLLPPLYIQPSGKINLIVEQFTWQQAEIINLKAKLNWLNAGVQGESFDLGTLQADIKHSTGKIQFELSDDSPVLDLSGQVSLASSGLLNTNVQLMGQAEFPEKLKSLLQTVMKRNNKNQLVFKNKQMLRSLQRAKIKF